MIRVDVQSPTGIKALTTQRRERIVLTRLRRIPATMHL